jgi:branched-chain amino acid aminotransferase
VSLAECKFVWKNGVMVPWKEATVHVSCHGLHYGTGVFEGIRCYDTSQGPAVFRLGAHLDRWFASARIYGMEWRYARQDLVRAVLEVIRANGFRECYVRPIAFYGAHSLSLNPRGCPVEVLILAWPWGRYLGADALEHGIDVTVSHWRKLNAQAVPVSAKACGQYLNSVLATQDAEARGFREAILLHNAGYLTEGPGENIFIVKNKHIITNDERSSILPGVTRDSVLRLAEKLGFAIDIRQLELNDLFTADEAFFTSTAVEITPIVCLEAQKIGRGTRGPVTATLQQAYLDVATGRDERYLDWLTYVS